MSHLRISLNLILINWLLICNYFLSALFPDDLSHLSLLIILWGVKRLSIIIWNLLILLSSTIGTLLIIYSILASILIISSILISNYLIILLLRDTSLILNLNVHRVTIISTRRRHYWNYLWNFWWQWWLINIINVNLSFWPCSKTLIVRIYYILISICSWIWVSISWGLVEICWLLICISIWLVPISWSMSRSWSWPLLIFGSIYNSCNLN